MYPSLLLCLSPRGNVSQCNGVPVACYDLSTCSDDIYVPRCNGVLVGCHDSSTHVDDRHLHCWVMYDCSCKDVPLGFMTSHVDPGSLSFECWRHLHIREPKDANGPSPGKVAAVEFIVREAAK